MKTFGGEVRIPIRDLQRLCKLVKGYSEIADRYAEEGEPVGHLALELSMLELEELRHRHLSMLELEIVTEVLDLFDAYGGNE